jgi:hypothetical protein
MKTHIRERVKRHRDGLRAAGLRPVQIWVLDTRSAEFVAEVRRQCLALKKDPAELEAIAFCEAAAASVEGWE